MRRVGTYAFVLAVSVAATATAARAVAQEPRRAPQPEARRAPQAPAAQLPDPQRMKQLLKVWEQQSANLKSLDVKIDRTDNSPAWGVEEFKGRAMLESPNRAFLDFAKVEKGKPQPVPQERIVCTGQEVWQYRSDTKQIFIYPLEKQAQQRALEEGPLPFLFNMRAADAEARYNMALVNETPSYFVISVVPKLRIDQESFSKAFLQLNRNTYLPDKIFLVSPDGNSTKEFRLSDVRPNIEIPPQNFQVKVLGPPWTVHREDPRAANNPAAPGVGNRPPPPAPAGAPLRRR
jgi:TIGR03009 family protein